MGGVRRVGEEIASEVIHAVINRECLLFARSPLETGRTRSSMHHRKADVCTSRIRANHELRPRCHQEVSTTITPKSVCEENEFVGQQFVVSGDRTPSAKRGTRPELCRSSRQHRGVRAGKKAGSFHMKVPVEEICVVGGLGENIRHKIRRSRVGIVIELRTNRTEACRKSDVVPDILVRVFNSYAYGPMLI